VHRVDGIVVVVVLLIVTMIVVVAFLLRKRRGKLVERRAESQKRNDGILVVTVATVATVITSIICLGSSRMVIKQHGLEQLGGGSGFVERASSRASAGEIEVNDEQSFDTTTNG